jgi:hypothetical protein
MTRVNCLTLILILTIFSVHQTYPIFSALSTKRVAQLCAFKKILSAPARTITKAQPFYLEPRAHQFVLAITINNLLQIYPNEIIAYLYERIRLSMADPHEALEEYNTVLNRYTGDISETGIAQTFLKQHQKSIPRASYYHSTERATFYFPWMVEENHVHSIRRTLGCYIGELAGWEKEYALKLKQVTAEEFSRKMQERFNAVDLITARLAESKKMAEAILPLLAKQ